MRPLLHASLVNGRFGDPAVYLETLFERRAFLFDLGDIAALPSRKIHRLEHVFVSHAHIDHFVGFDRLLRILVGREKAINLYGPPGFVEHVHHKLQAYRWNLADRYLCDLNFVVREISASLATRIVQFRLKRGFDGEEVGRGWVKDGIIHSEPNFQVSTALLEHRTPCLGFAITESVHVNVWKNRLFELGLPVGPWLRDLKRAIIDNKPDNVSIRVRAGNRREVPLGELRSVVTVASGQKIGYVTDVADVPSNRKAIIALVRDADLLFIEAPFAEADTELAVHRAHLTTAAAGRIAREARVRRIEPFHFSPRYSGEESRMLSEVMTAFAEGHSDPHVQPS